MITLAVAPSVCDSLQSNSFPDATSTLNEVSFSETSSLPDLGKVLSSSAGIQ